MDNFGGFLKLTKYEVRGLLVVALVLVVMILVKLFVVDEYSELEVKQESLVKEVSKKSNKNQIKDNNSFRGRNHKTLKNSSLDKENNASNSISNISLLTPDSHIDINTVVQYDLTELGFSESKANTIIKYRNSIGGFERKDQFSKIYVINQSEIYFLRKFSKIKLKPVQLNMATIEDLKEVKGVGDVLSVRIVKYRDLLGGYVRIRQLKEVYGIDERNYSLIKDKFIVDSASVQKITIPIASFDELEKHPYISEYLAMKMIKDRSVGRLNTVVDLKELIKDEDDFQKIKYYVRF